MGMRTGTLASLSLLLLLPLVAISQTVKLPTESTGDVGQLVVIRAETDCPTLRWLPLDKGLSIVPPDLLKDSKAAVAYSSVPGKYRLMAYGAKGDTPSDPAITTVVISGPEPPPTPGPGPQPPGPGPGPTPGPVDPLAARFIAAYATETDPAKAQLLAKLREFYAVVSISGTTTSATTWGTWFDSTLILAQQLKIAGKLPAVQAVAQAELRSILPANRDQALDADGRKLIVDTFARLAKIVEGMVQSQRSQPKEKEKEPTKSKRPAVGEEVQPGDPREGRQWRDNLTKIDGAIANLNRRGGSR